MKFRINMLTKVIHKNKVVNLIKNIESVLNLQPGTHGSVMLHGFKKKDLEVAVKYFDDPERVTLRYDTLDYICKSTLTTINLFY